MSCILISHRNPSSLVILFPILQKMRSRKLGRKLLEASRFMVMEEIENYRKEARDSESIISEAIWGRDKEPYTPSSPESITVLHHLAVVVSNDGPGLSRKGSSRFSVLCSIRRHSL